MLRYALPEYRLPRDVVRREVELIRRMGVEFVCGVAVGTDITLNDLDNQYNAVFLAIGTWKEAWVYLPGTELKGVLPALLFLEAVAKEEPVRLGRRVVVIGGGNAAIDSARTVAPHGRGSDRDLPPRAQGHAGHPRGDRRGRSTKAPSSCSWPRRTASWATRTATSRPSRWSRPGWASSTPPGRRRPVPTEEIRRLECDTVILAVGEAVDLDFVARLRPAHQGGRHAGSGPLHARNQPQQVLRRRRPDHRRLQRLQRHGLRQEGRAQHRPAADGRRAVGAHRTRSSSTATRRPSSPAKAARHTVDELPRGRARGEFRGSHDRPLAPRRRSDEAGRCLRCDIKDHH